MAQPQWWPGERPGDTATGTVTAVSAQSISIDAPRGAMTFVVTDATRVMVKGQKAGIGDVSVGDQVVIRFVRKDGKLWAKGILVPKPRVRGRITAVNGNVLTVNNKEKGMTWSVTVPQGIKIVSHGYQGTIDDLKVGYGIAIEGETDGNNIQAERIEFVPWVVRGVVDSVNGNEIVVKTIRQYTVTVTATDATVVLIRPRIAANQKGTLEDVKAGLPVNIGGHRTGEAAIQALWIDVLTATAPTAGQQNRSRAR